MVERVKQNKNMSIKEYIKKLRAEGSSDEEIENQLKIIREYPEVFKDDEELKEVILILQS